jgi:pantetheine-phosphate adenylyltransferase
MNPSNRKAVLPGSYDPVTNGHLDVIGRAARMFDEIVVGVVNVQVRKSKALFTAEERCSMVEEATKHLDNISVVPFSTLVVEFAHEQGAAAIVKGLRTITDFGYEFEMNQLNRRQDPDIESVYLMASPQYSFLSSSGVKELATFDGNIDDLVPPGIAGRLKEALKR